MKLSAFTDAKHIDLEVAPGGKDEVIGAMVKLLSRSRHVGDGDAFLRDVLAREALVTTGVGYGVAFPHAKSDSVKRVVLAFGRTTADVDFGALDGLPVRLVFLIGAPKAQEPSRVYLNLMARLSFLMKDEGNRQLLLDTDSVKEVLSLLDSVG
jgi:mannitol/fructose-specific phosphotransferase system IIA component (Ntr-type)